MSDKDTKESSVLSFFTQPAKPVKPLQTDEVSQDLVDAMEIASGEAIGEITERNIAEFKQQAIDSLAENFRKVFPISYSLRFAKLADEAAVEIGTHIRQISQEWLKELLGLSNVKTIVNLHWVQNNSRLEAYWMEAGKRRTKGVPRDLWAGLTPPTKQNKKPQLVKQPALTEATEEKEQPSFTDRERERQKRRQTKKKGPGLGEED